MKGHFDYESFDWTSYYEVLEREWDNWASEYLAWWESL